MDLHARKSAADATRRASGLDIRIPDGAAAIYSPPNNVAKVSCMVARGWRGVTGWCYQIVLTSGSELTAVSGDRLARGEGGVQP